MKKQHGKFELALHRFVMWAGSYAWVRDFFWAALAQIVAIPLVSNAIINRAMKSPHQHVIRKGLDTHTNLEDLYMGRWWVWNRYADKDGINIPGANDLWPSVRANFINREDSDRHAHDHPWNARTFLMRGWYVEVREKAGWGCYSTRRPGQTATLNVGEYHRIIGVAPGGCWTLFFTWAYVEAWGFDVAGVKVPSRDYFDQYQNGNEI